MKKNTVEKIILFTFIFLVFTSEVSAYSFSRNLAIGSTGEDVRQLQLFLNNYSSQTRISANGAGAIGNETSYFGNLTKNALIKFQELNFAQILKPVGLSKGTGYFGPSTIKFINNNPAENISVTENQEVPLYTNPQTQAQTNLNYEGYLIATKEKVKEGDSLFVGSDKNISELDIFIGDKKVNKKCKTEYFCELETDGITVGKQTIKTNIPNMYTGEITIIDSNEKTPEINIKSLKLNTENTFSGKNLTEIIKVYSIFGTKEVNTDNNSFNVSFETEATALPENIQQGPFYIENSNGLSSDIIIIKYEI